MLLPPATPPPPLTRSKLPLDRKLPAPLPPPIPQPLSLPFTGTRVVRGWEGSETRQGQNVPSLGQRTFLAQHAKADLFIFPQVPALPRHKCTCVLKMLIIQTGQYCLYLIMGLKKL
jgi:hypothetical protein